MALDDAGRWRENYVWKKRTCRCKIRFAVSNPVRGYFMISDASGRRVTMEAFCNQVGCSLYNVE
jgi:hypothetical protein